MSLGDNNRLKQGGDTIVEVMIVLAVLGLAIGICYRTAIKSLQAARAAQENSQAVQLLQSQVEVLYSKASIRDNTDPNYIFRGGTFCVDTQSPPTTPPYNIVNILPIASPAPATCTQSIYNVTIVYCGANSGGDPVCTTAPGHTTDDTFVLTAIWDDVDGQGKDRAQLTYRLHQL